MAQQVRDFLLNQQQIRIDSSGISSPQVTPNYIGQQNQYQINYQQNNYNLKMPMNNFQPNDSTYFGIPLSKHPHYQDLNQHLLVNQQQQQFYLPQGVFNLEQQQSNYNPQNNNNVNQFTSPVGKSSVRHPQNGSQQQKSTETNNDQKHLLNYNQLQINRASSEKISQLNSPCIYPSQYSAIQMGDHPSKNHSSVHSLESQINLNLNSNNPSQNTQSKSNYNNNNNNNINSLQPQAPSSQSYSIDQRRLKIQDFKVHECTKRDKHEKKKCPYFHNQGDRRRCPEKYQYSFNECKKKDKCPLKDNCPQVHNKVEQLYHPLRYKAKFCESFKENNQKCEYGSFCSFAHDENEIVIPMICKLPKDAIFYMYFYKTVWCPNTQKHERAYCPYMHNVQDFRRDPKQFQIEPKQCDQWKKSNIQKYSEGECPLQLKCKNCHGWKEYDYHPKFYKTKSCDTQNCQNQECVHYHSEQERRIVTEELLKKEEKEAKEKLKSLINSNIPYDVKLGAPIDVFYTEQEEEMNNSSNGSNANLNQNMSYHNNSNNNNNSNSNSSHSKNSSNTDLNNQNNLNYNPNSNNQKNRFKSNTVNIQNNSYPQNRQQSNSQYGQQQNYYNHNQKNHDKAVNHQRTYDKKQPNFNQNNSNNNNNNNNNNNYHHQKQQNNSNNIYQNFANNSNNNNNNNYNNSNSNNYFVDNYQKNLYQNNQSNNRQQQNAIYNQSNMNNINNLNYFNTNYQNNYIPYCAKSQNQSDIDQTTSSKSQSQQQSRDSSLGKNDSEQQTIINDSDRRTIQINQEDIFFQFNEPKLKYSSELRKCFEKKSQTELYETLLLNYFNDEQILKLADTDNYLLPFLNDNQSNTLKNIISYYYEEQDYKDIQKLGKIFDEITF
ncbi:zinc finger CCCH type domain protein (macronuclear) [Tetrahymena thermophila SB210]|uniref:Zinc finger CCCH type domain protein n=1 Tax=Tetrahymena thermophila (strain SB210) TaxID=312017 RepID=Q22W09_TETTS|nr:zinc finger CCCH type domain protein [Tetrahymena thermophila SB210]EAR89607.3 zinc finger CCCH type domain protein [Tetrahymena thermophila SB210]|eukprot:XP_001009853.3 zinc finger CCCH type domain protein [Tetrahymena thermophila SB210]